MHGSQTFKIPIEDARVSPIYSYRILLLPITNCFRLEFKLFPMCSFFHFPLWTVLVSGEYTGRRSNRIKMNGVYFSSIRSNSKHCEFG